MTGAISVISREDGSGTRGAFIELMGIEQDDVDMTTEMAEITNSTSVMMTTVAGNKQAIGYVSVSYTHLSCRYGRTLSMESRDSGRSGAPIYFGI